MKVSGSGGSAPLGGPAPRPAAAGFSPQTPTVAEGAVAVGRTAGAGALTALGALLVLQETAGPLERRRRAVQRGTRLLDGLETLKLAMIGGAPADGVLQGLSAAALDRRDATEDAGLESLLDQIDLRAAVELAKRGARAAA